MHEAIQLITKTLATHLPPPALTPDINQPSPETATDPITKDPVSSQPEILTDSLPQATMEDEITPVTAESSTSNQASSSEELPTEPPVEEQSPPKRPNAEKRTSVIGSIGKFLWPFGG